MILKIQIIIVDLCKTKPTGEVVIVLIKIKDQEMGPQVNKILILLHPLIEM